MNELKLKINDSISIESIAQRLIELGFCRHHITLDTGDFSIRGDILDIYPPNTSHPIRIECDLNRIERINGFATQTQRSIKKFTNIVIQAFDSKQQKNAKVMLNETNFTKDIISDLFSGNYVVHEEFGIGIFEGLEYKNFSNTQGEYIKIKYKDNDSVFVPINHIDRIHKYRETDTPPKLNSLNNHQWLSQTKKAKADTLRLAEELLETHKERAQKKGFSFSPDTELQLQIENEFEYTLTPDQESALTDIKEDMESTLPMERLICGDVGFGKTELLVRASLKALESGKQVAVLAPTTVLVEQHIKTFQKRLKNTPYICKHLSRFTNSKEKIKTIDDLKHGRCDCVIGTHALLSKNIYFNDLGLLIIDEEQRFGVKHKEKIKQLKSNIDIINVSATPIPRTLYKAINSNKDLSLIQTPPKNRKPIKTIVETWSDNRVIEAITEETKQGGQVFYVFNNITQIEQKAEKLKTLIPNLKIEIAHGQHHESHIKKTIENFINHKFDCLLSTTLIENGIDIPNANTLIIDGVETMGLSQIHQLRGRVGRSEKQAYAYLLYSPTKELNKTAQQRLNAITEYISLGSGYDIALRDLEIRGSGSLLGREQHGHIISIGFSYYCKLLNDSINEKSSHTKDESLLNLETQKITIQADYIQNPRERFAIYKKFLNLRSFNELEDLKYELEDRYGRFNQNINKIWEYLTQKLNEATITKIL